MKEFSFTFIILFIIYLIYRLIRYYEKELSKLECRIELLNKFIKRSTLIPFGSKRIMFEIMEGMYDKNK